MTTKQKLESIRLELAQRKLLGVSNIGDHVRSLKAEIYADVMRRHPIKFWMRLPRIVKAVNSVIGL